MIAKTFGHMFLTQLGNDFLPNLQSLDIYDRKGGLNILMEAYKEARNKQEGYLVKEGSINEFKLQCILQFLKRDEEYAYKRQEVRIKHRFST